MRNLHARMLRYLDEVARTGSIRRAAGRLNVAASSINRQILALEEELGTPIFERLPRALRLTAAGEVVIAHIRRTLDDADRTQAHLEELRGLRRGEISVATMSGLGADLLAQAAIAFRDRHPRVRLAFHVRGLEEILAHVLAGEADLGLAFNTGALPGLHVALAVDFPLGAVVAPRHPLADQRQVSLAQMVAHGLIMPSSSMSMRPLLDAALARAGLAPDPGLEANEVDMIKRLAGLGQGVALLNRLNVERERQRGELVFVPLRERDLPPQRLRVFHRESAAPAVLTARFIETLRQTLGEMQP